MKIFDWIKSNWIISGLILVGMLLFTPKTRKMLLGSPARKRRPRRRATVTRTRTVTRRSSSPVTRSSARGYAAAGGGTIPFKYNKDGSIKKAQFVAGTLAAKRRMSQLRKNR